MGTVLFLSRWLLSMVIPLTVVGSLLPIRTFLAAFVSGLSTPAAGRACSSPLPLSRSNPVLLQPSPPPTAWRDTTPVSSASPILSFPPSYRPSPHPRLRIARDQHAVPPGPAPYCMSCSHLRLCIAFNCTYTIYMYHQPHPPATRFSATAHDIASRSFGIYSSLIGVLCVLGRHRRRHRIRIHNHIIHHYSSPYLIRPLFGWA